MEFFFLLVIFAMAWAYHQGKASKAPPVPVQAGFTAPQPIRVVEPKPVRAEAPVNVDTDRPAFTRREAIVDGNTVLLRKRVEELEQQSAQLKARLEEQVKAKGRKRTTKKSRSDQDAGSVPAMDGGDFIPPLEGSRDPFVDVSLEARAEAIALLEA